MIKESVIAAFIDGLPPDLVAQAQGRLQQTIGIDPDHRSACDSSSWKSVVESWKIRKSLAKKAKDTTAVHFCDLQIAAGKKIAKGSFSWVRYDGLGVMMLVADDESEILAYSIGDAPDQVR